MTIASPLSPKASTVMNTVTSVISARQSTHAGVDYKRSASGDDLENLQSSPPITSVRNSQEPEYISPIKSSKSWISPSKRNAASPVKMQKSPSKGITQSFEVMDSGKTGSSELPAENRHYPAVSSEESILLMQDTEGLQKSTQNFGEEEDISGYREIITRPDDTLVGAGGESESESLADITTLSTFSAAPDMTTFAKTGHSPIRLGNLEETKKLGAVQIDYTTSSPFAFRPQNGGRDTIDDNDDPNTTNLLLDFTEQFNRVCERQSPRRKDMPSPEFFAHARNDRTPLPTKYRQRLKSPSKIVNLLDFDIPPAPTPRSLPTITARELESLKSGYLSEISSLKASISGKEAEVLSLKSAVDDAEKRVGKCMEQVREERNLRGQLNAEKEGWEKRGREMELLLRSAKEEILHREREREELESRIEDNERRREAAETTAREAENKMAGMLARSNVVCTDGVAEKKSQQESTSGEVEVAVEKVAKELHALYKNKHETKVAALKKSYEGRWAKKVRDLETKLEELSKENEELKVGRDATMSGVVPGVNVSDATEELRLQAARDAGTIKELEARLQGLTEEVKSVKGDNLKLYDELEKERIEKGELVAACDELLALQDASPVAQLSVESTAEKLRSSISRGSGRRAPNIPGLSNEGRIAKVERKRSVGARPISGLGSRSGIMSAIEKMGGHK